MISSRKYDKDIKVKVTSRVKFVETKFVATKEKENSEAPDGTSNSNQSAPPKLMYCAIVEDENQLKEAQQLWKQLNGIEFKDDQPLNCKWYLYINPLIFNAMVIEKDVVKKNALFARSIMYSGATKREGFLVSNRPFDHFLVARQQYNDAKMGKNTTKLSDKISKTLVCYIGTLFDLGRGPIVYVKEFKSADKAFWCEATVIHLLSDTGSLAKKIRPQAISDKFAKYGTTENLIKTAVTILLDVQKEIEENKLNETEYCPNNQNDFN